MEEILIEEAKQIHTDTTLYIDGYLSKKQYRDRLMDDCRSFGIYAIPRWVALLNYALVFVVVVLVIAYNIR